MFVYGPQTTRADTMYQSTAKGFSGLVTYYTFDGVASGSTTLTDDSGNGHTGTFTTGAIGASSDTAGVGSGQSLSFNSSGSAYVSGISETGFPEGSADRSVVFWMKTTQTYASNTWPTVFEFGTEGTLTAGFGVGLSGDNLGHIVASQWGAAVTGPSVTDDRWHMITLTAASQGDGNALWSLYVDNSTTPSTSVLATNTTLGNNGYGGQIGSANGCIPYVGSVDELAYYNRVLTTAEMGSLYSAMTTPEPSTVVLLVTGGVGLLAYAWRKRRS
jgi:hypothetical protein